MAAPASRATAEVDLDAITHNAGLLAAAAAPAALLAVVKADAYGHGAAPSARAALRGGASWLGVAMPSEARALRSAGLDVPILLLAEPRLHELDEAVRLGLRVTVSSPEVVDRLAETAGAAGASVAVHLKVDTGMHRSGVDPKDALALARRVSGCPELVLEGVSTHCAVADEPGNGFTDRQRERFCEVLAELAADGIEPMLRHMANSAATIDHPETRFDLVRCGIALYGIAPAPALAGRLPLRPALRLLSEVAMVRRVEAGDGVSYGHRWRAPRATTIATVPIGYADGVPRRLGAVGGEVLIRGRRHPIAGSVTMDQITVDVGDEPVQVGDEVVLLGRQGGDDLDAWELATKLDTIAYELTTRVGPRVPRHNVGGAP